VPTVTDTNPRVRYAATNGQTVFAVPFEFFDNSDVKVYQNGTLKTLTTHYTLTGAGVVGGGNCTLVTGAALDDDILIFRDLPVEKEAEFATSGPFSMASLNDLFSKLIMMIGQLEYLFNYRTLRLAVTDEEEQLDALPVLADRAGKIFSFDDDGHPAASIEAQDILDAAAALATAESSATAAAASATAAAGSATSAAASAVLADADADSASTSLADLLASGKVIRSGAGAPAGGLGNNGDFYIDSSAWNIYGPKAGGAWGSATSLVGPSGAGSGDMIAANNLSDVANAATAFTNIKQAATETATGVVELATTAEADTGTDTTRAITAAGLKSHVDAAVAALRNGVDGALDTLAEIATSLAGKLVAASNLSDVANAGTARTNLSAAARAQTDFISVLIDTPEDQDYQILQNIPYAITITKLTTITAAGTATVTGKIGTTALGGTANSATTSQQEQAHASANAMAIGDDFKLTLSSVSSCDRLTVVIEFTRTLA
jgi:hypothetical protein